jgi:DNA polymerase III subunit gamma/tau
MSYLVLARKYRPRHFGEMVGQEHVVQALSNALTQQRLHHAYLFTGTRGVGKTTVSRILAKSLNCTGPDGTGGITAQPCGQCSACTDIDSGRHVDYVELDAASNRGVEEISQLLDQAVYKPVVGRFKVYMIDEVHMLSATAFNAMLKTLEEPPEYLKFVLATTDPQKVPVTVLSRCLQFNLRPMAVQTMQQHLQAVLHSESIPADDAALRLLARAARGSMRDALSLADQAIAFGAGRLDEAPVRQMLGAVDRSHAVRIIESLVAADGPALLAAVDGLRALGLPAAGTLEEVAALAQQMAVAQAAPQALPPDDPETAVAQRLGGQLPADETQLLYSVALHGREELALAPDEYAGLVMVLLRVLAFRSPAEDGGARLEGRAARPGQSAAGGARAAAALTSPATATATVVLAAEVSRPAAARPDREPPPWLDDEPPLQDLSPSARAAPSSRQPWAEPALPGHAVATAAELPSAPSAPSASAAPMPQRQATAHSQHWVDCVARLARVAGFVALVRELALQAEGLELDLQVSPAVVRLRVERESLRADALRDKLRALLAAELAQPVALTLEPGQAQDSVALREAEERQRRQQEAERIILDDPWVQGLLRQYKTARIVPGSVKPH